ncbi:MAG: thiamine-phosphate pyrophosphorylase [Flavobacteriales bacterium]|jgi:thiamine-phosphate pyrophosphorylase
MPNEIMPYSNKLKTLAQEQRKNSALSEGLLWKQIKAKSFGVEFHRQVPMLNYIVGFYCHEIKLAIEIDGSSHATELADEADKKRQDELEQHGVTFLRIADIDVKQQMDNVLRVVEDKITALHNKYPDCYSLNNRINISKEKIAKLQFITQPVAGKSTAALVREVCESGVRWIQLRLKEADEFVWEQEAIAVWEVCQDFGATFIINDNVELAKRVMADGVHLGKEDMHPQEARAILGDDAIIGVTASTFEDIKKAADLAIDYIGLGPYNNTNTKKKLSPILGENGFEEIAIACLEQEIKLPIVAVGGIQLTDVGNIQAMGFHGIAVSGLIAHTDNKKHTVSQLFTILKELAAWKH